MPGDSLFVAFDNIGISTRINSKTGVKVGFDSGDFIRNTTQKCRLCNVNFYCTTYYCFEELYLSYTELLNLCIRDCKIADLCKALSYVQNHIKAGTEYFDRNNQNVQYIANLRADALYNKEHFADALLYQVTYNIKHGKFTISKERKKNCFLKCRIDSCDNLRVTDKVLSNSTFMCDHCKFNMANNTDIDKLLDLEKKSLLNNNSTALKFNNLNNTF